MDLRYENDVEIITSKRLAQIVEQKKLFKKNLRGVANPPLEDKG